MACQTPTVATAYLWTVTQESILQEVYQRIGPVLVEELQAEAVASGLEASGDLVRTIEWERVAEALFIELNAYGIYMDAGVPPGRVKPGRAYIEGLKRWLQIKGIPEEAAWAIATVHQRRGIPVDKSKLGWIDRGVSNAVQKALSAIEGGLLAAWTRSSAELAERMTANAKA